MAKMTKCPCKEGKMESKTNFHIPSGHRQFSTDDYGIAESESGFDWVLHHPRVLGVVSTLDMPSETSGVGGSRPTRT